MSSPTDLLLLRREVELEKRAAELRRDNALEFFQPHTKQNLFFQNASFHYRYARTGNRFGKSEMGAAEDVAFALGYRPWYPKGNPLRTLGIPEHPTKGLIITTDWDKSTEVFTETNPPQVGKLIKYIPKHVLGQPTKNHSGAIDRIPVRHISGGWSMIRLDTVKSYKQNPLGQESGDNDWIHIDEPIPEGMWKACARGLVDRGGHAWFTCTPISEPWIDAAFIPDLSDQTKSDLGTIEMPEQSRWMMTGEMDDNPHNTPEYIANYMSWLNDDEKEARRKGVPLSYSGLVYKEFSWNDHVLLVPPWKDWDAPVPADYCIRLSVDYHFRKNDAVLFIATSPPPHEYHYIFAEIWQQLLVEDEVKEIRSVLRNHPYQPILMEPLASTPNKVTDITPMDEYRRHGLAIIPATKDPVNGIRSVKAILKSRDKTGKPIIYVNPACRRFLFEISRGFIWDGDENKPVKKNDDMMECFYRLALQGLPYIAPSDDSDFSYSPPLDLPDAVFSPFEFESKPKTKNRLAFANRYRN